jgi:hypothetical protein
LYKFVIAGRHGYWSKDFETGLTNALSVENYAIEKIINIAVEEVSTTRIHSVRLFSLRESVSVGSINYLQENAKQYNLKSSTNPDEIVCRALFSGEPYQLCLEAIPKPILSKLLFCMSGSQSITFFCIFESKIC